jgi:hypothetical protein
MKTEPITPGKLYRVTDNKTRRQLEIIAPNTWAALLIGIKVLYQF